MEVDCEREAERLGGVLDSASCLVGRRGVAHSQRVGHLVEPVNRRFESLLDVCPKLFGWLWSGAIGAFVSGNVVDFIEPGLLEVLVGAETNATSAGDRARVLVDRHGRVCQLDSLVWRDTFVLSDGGKRFSVVGHQGERDGRQTKGCDLHLG